MTSAAARKRRAAWRARLRAEALEARRARRARRLLSIERERRARGDAFALAAAVAIELLSTPATYPGPSRGPYVRQLRAIREGRRA